MLILFIIICIILIYIIGYHDMIIQRYTIQSHKINTKINIAIISDLHGTSYGKHQSQLLQKMKQQNLDMIFFVGDLVDEHSGIKEVEDLFKGLKDIPSYYVLGNHEISSQKVDIMKELSIKYNICMIGQDYQVININQNQLCVAGIDDLAYFKEKDNDNYEEIFQQNLEQLSHNIDKNIYSILLSHKPSLVDLYKNSHFDLIISGHAHGGQWCIPHVLNGLYAPDEHLFPHYAGGLYQFDHNQLLVGRGLVKNLIPRFFNPPELVILTLDNLK